MSIISDMTRWKKDATEFDVSIRTLKNKDGSESFDCAVPKPIIELLNYPKKLTFKLRGKKIEIESE